jgi:hypothetical protein
MVSIRQASDAVLRTRDANVARTAAPSIRREKLTLRVAFLVILVLSIATWQLVIWGLRAFGL